ncbi:MAG: hypothetical protein H6R14_2123 [Proteobacteria bacterium]|nr:hypothetical protein [Pseudomonadota bacterium]
MVLADSFHTLSDTRALYLKHLGALLRDADLISPPAIESIQNGAAAYFDEMTSTNRRGTFAEEVDGLTSSRITLVGEEDLELGIRLDNMTARLFESTGGSLWKTHLRFVTLLRRPDLPKSANPVGPKGVVEGLNAMFEAAGAVAISKKLELLDRIEACLLEGLPALYAEINDFLDRNGIDAAQPAIITAKEGAVAATAPDAAPAIPENALLALQQTLLARVPGLADAPAMPMGGSGGGAASSLLNQAMLERLVTRLDELDRQGVLEQRFASPKGGDGMIPALFSSDGNFASHPKVLKSAELGIPTTAGEGLAIDTLAMIFEAIFANPALPDALKSVISSLQITLLKVAMKDNSLFGNAQHPARLVIDRMGQAVLGLPQDVSARHPVFSRLAAIATALRADPAGELDAFETALQQLDALIDERGNALAEAAKPYIPAIALLERDDEAAIRAGQALEKFLESRPPASIRSFIEQSWSKLLQKVWLANGEQSAEWQEALSVIEDLLWTIQPKADADERKTLARRLPDILKRLKDGMGRIGLAPDAEAAFLDECFELQTRALRAMPAPAPVDDPGAALFAGNVAVEAGTPLSGKLGLDELTLDTLDFAEFRPPPSRPLACKVGDWLEMPSASGDKCIGRVCHISPISKRTLLLNPECHLALAVHPAILDRQLRSGEARVVSAVSLFETAASSALHQTSVR